MDGSSLFTVLKRDNGFGIVIKSITVRKFKAWESFPNVLITIDFRA